MTVAAFMNLALYDPQYGYYARAAQRSGRAGDFFTSVDVGSTFGELIESQLAEFALFIPGSFDLVEGGAGNARLSADILRAARERHPDFYSRIQLHLCETSPTARDAQRATLGMDGDRLHASSASLPERFEGALVANELLDAMPVHQVVMRDAGLREIYVTVVHDATASRDVLTTIEGEPSTPALEQYLQDVSAQLKPGWRGEIGLDAVQWIRDAGARLTRGFLLIVDYGHEAQDLFSASHAGGTLTTFARHVAEGPEARMGTPTWLQRPGDQDITAHVDFTSVRRAAEAEGFETLGFLDQTYFLMGLLDAEMLERSSSPMDQLKRRLALKTLLLPGGLGSTMKVLILGKNVGRPSLRGCSYRTRVT